jgi:hypothetical protein
MSPLHFDGVVKLLEERSIEGQADLWLALRQFNAICDICTMDLLNTDLKQLRRPMLVRVDAT